MKKKILLSIILTLVIVLNIFVGVAVVYADTTSVTHPDGGKVLDVTLRDNNVYYTNGLTSPHMAPGEEGKFVYQQNTKAETGWYVEYQYSAFYDGESAFFDNYGEIKVDALWDDATGKINANDNSVTEVQNGEAEITVKQPKAEPVVDGDNLFYVFIDEYDKTDDKEKYSKPVVVCVDTIAPTVDLERVKAWLHTAPLEGEDKNNQGLHSYFISGGKDWEFPVGWAEDIVTVVEQNSRFEAKPEEDDEEETETKAETKINRMDLLVAYIEYLSPSSDDANDWTDTKGDEDMDLKEIGEWTFKFLLEDAAGNVAVFASGDKEGKDFYYRTTHFVRETSAPTIEYTATQKKVSTVGTVAGQAYSIPTPTVTNVITSTTTTYVVEKYTKIDGKLDWYVIFNSASDFEEEGFKDGVRVGFEDYVKRGTITPATNEVTKTTTDSDGNKKYEYTYRVKHTTVNQSMYTNNTEYLNLYITSPDSKLSDPYFVWKIVLIVIACLAAIGIIVLIFVKPKEELAPQLNAKTKLADNTKTEDNKDDNINQDKEE